MSKKEKVEIKLEGKAAEMWNDIRSQSISMFALPNKTVAEFCEPKPIDTNRLFLTTKISSFFPALEEKIGGVNGKYNVTLETGYIIVEAKAVK